MVLGPADQYQDLANGKQECDRSGCEWPLPCLVYVEALCKSCCSCSRIYRPR
jgi:hypothetical protein